jgi:hypothetical protein
MDTVLKGKLVASNVYDSAEPVKLRFELANKGDVDPHGQLRRDRALEDGVAVPRSRKQR